MGITDDVRANRGVCCLLGVLMPKARLATALCLGVPATDGVPSRKSGPRAGAFGIDGSTRVSSISTSSRSEVGMSLGGDDILTREGGRREGGSGR